MEPPSLPPLLTEQTATAVAELGTIQPVLSVEARVVAGVEFPLVAPERGKVLSFAEHGARMEFGDGSRRLIEFPQGSQLVEWAVEPDMEVPAQDPIARLRYDGFAMQGGSRPGLGVPTAVGCRGGTRDDR